jgi:hypothetical protein
MRVVADLATGDRFAHATQAALGRDAVPIRRELREPYSAAPFKE